MASKKKNAKKRLKTTNPSKPNSLEAKIQKSINIQNITIHDQNSPTCSNLSKNDKTGGFVTMCTGCDAPCCRLVVELSSYDIFRIAIQEKINTEEFVAYGESQTNDLGTFRSLGKYLKFYLKTNGKDCIFLETSGALRCRIKNSKPSICIEYPFSISTHGPVMRPDAACPPQGLRFALQYYRDLHSIIDAGSWEWQKYGEIISDWNRIAKGDEKPDEFLRFAAKEMDLEASPLGSIYRKIRRPLLGIIKSK